MPENRGQMPLPLPGAAEEDELFAIILGIAERMGRQEFAFQLQMTEGACNHAITRARRSDGRIVQVLGVEKLLAITLMPGGERLVEFLARRIGLDVVAAVPPSVEEEHTALLQVLDEQLGGELRKGLLHAQRTRIRENRGAAIAAGKGRSR